MSFYNRVASHYDYIFPAYTAQIKFLKESFGQAPKQILDIACGTGSYALELAKQGYSMSALDADQEMIENAKVKVDIENIQVALIHCSMENIKESIEGTFDGAYCIGNSLVHLENKEKISCFLKDLYDVLHEGAKVVIQIMNYDRIIRNEVTELPPIINDEVGLKFFRSYRISEDQQQVAFDTILHLKDKVEEHTTMLVPLLKEESQVLLQQAGFKVVNCYGDFEGIPFNKDASYHCIFVVEK